MELVVILLWEPFMVLCVRSCIFIVLVPISLDLSIADLRRPTFDVRLFTDEVASLLLAIFCLKPGLSASAVSLHLHAIRA